MYPRQKLSSLELWHLVLMSVLFLILVSSPKAILLIFLFFPSDADLMSQHWVFLFSGSHMDNAKIGVCDAGCVSCCYVWISILFKRLFTDSSCWVFAPNCSHPLFSSQLVFFLFSTHSLYFLNCLFYFYIFRHALLTTFSGGMFVVIASTSLSLLLCTGHNSISFC